MIADLSSALAQFMVSASYKTVTETIVDGESVRTYSDALSKQFIILPMDGETLRQLPDGEYTSEDKQIFETGGITLKANDIVIYKSVEYLISTVIDYTEQVNTTKYIGKRLWQK